MRALLARDHEVTAFVRDAGRVPEDIVEAVAVAVGDVMDRARVEDVVRDQDAVVVCLGIRENPLMVRLRGSRGTPMRVRSEGTRHVAEARAASGAERLIVQSSYGVGQTRRRPSLLWRAIFALLLRPQIEDTERQEQIVRASDLAWTIVQPVGLTDGPEDAHVLASTQGEAASMSVSRASVARWIAEAIEPHEGIRQCVSLSATGAS